jgi:hypothetical protein
MSFECYGRVQSPSSGHLTLDLQKIQMSMEGGLLSLRGWLLNAERSVIGSWTIVGVPG